MIQSVFQFFFQAYHINTVTNFEYRPPVDNSSDVGEVGKCIKATIYTVSHKNTHEICS